MWKSAYVGVYQLLNWKIHGETLKLVDACVEIRNQNLSNRKYSGRHHKMFFGTDDAYFMCLIRTCTV